MESEGLRRRPLQFVPSSQQNQANDLVFTEPEEFDGIFEMDPQTPSSVRLGIHSISNPLSASSHERVWLPDEPKFATSATSSNWSAPSARTSQDKHARYATNKYAPLSTNSDPQAPKFTPPSTEFAPRLNGSASSVTAPLTWEWRSDREYQPLGAQQPHAWGQDEPMEAPSPIYVQPADEVMFKTAMSMVDFVPTDQSGNATIVVMTPSEATLTIANLNLNKLEKVCPLLGMSFEQSRSGGFKYCLEARSRVLAVSFLRFLCTGSYLIKDEDGLTVVPSSLFFHAEMYHLACTFDVGDLKKEAKANMMRVTEFSCSTPKPPRELCETIRFVYERLRNERELIGLIQHYCVNCFTYHQLNEDLIFRALIDDLPTFGIDLCTTNIQRNFEDEGAADIIQLPISMNEHTTRMQIEREALRNYIFELWGPEIFTSRTGYESETDASYTPSAPRRKFVLAQRPKHFPVKSPSTDDSDASDLEGFTVVHRPKPEKSTAESLKDPFSSDDDWESDMSTYSSARKQDTKGKGRAAPSTSFFANTAPPPTRSGTPTQDRPHVDDDTASSDSDFTVVSDVDEEVDFMMDDLGRAG